MRIGVYPGTFDPITNGHLDIIRRAKHLFDRLYILIPINPAKVTMFSIDERIEMIKLTLEEEGLNNHIEVVSTSLLTVEFAKSIGAIAIIRGLRMVSDFEYELQLSAVNKSLNPDIETIMIMSSHEYSFISSGMVKEIAHFNGDYQNFVSSAVAKFLKDKLS